MNNGPIEPPAELRQMAKMIRQVYLSLMQEDFTEKEALTIIGHILAANQGG